MHLLQASSAVGRRHYTPLPVAPTAARKGDIGAGAQLQGRATARQLRRPPSTAAGAAPRVKGSIISVVGACAPVSTMPTIVISEKTMYTVAIVVTVFSTTSHIRTRVSRPPCGLISTMHSSRIVVAADTSRPCIRLSAAPTTILVPLAEFGAAIHGRAASDISLTRHSDASPVDAFPMKPLHAVTRVSFHAIIESPVVVVTVPLDDVISGSDVLRVGAGRAA